MSWLFDRAGRIRRGGSAAAYAFTPDVEVFVREVVQNAKDQKRADAKQAKVHFKLMRLRGQSLSKFLAALGWADLKEHLAAAAGASAHAKFIERGLERLDSDRELLILRVDDSGTGGLTGGDTEDGRPFKSLCIDELFSEKESKGAGGSYGLGKSVLWRFSAFATVLFSSRLSEYADGQKGLRLFGRSQLPWHEMACDQYDGPCWFGREIEQGGQRLALSFWGGDAASRAIDLQLERADDAGTSILVVGFNPPAEETRHPKEMCRRFCTDAAVHFWPVLSGESPELEVTSELVDIESGTVEASHRTSIPPEIRPYVDCLEAFRKDETVEELAEKGDVAGVGIPVKIPRTIAGAPPVEGEVTLCVKLLPGGGRRANHVAYARGFGMVVRYRNLEGISLSARPFVATLLCGTLRGATSADQSVEEFLRQAEPPEHNTWTSNQRLQSAYGPGYRKAIDDLNRAVESHIKRLVSLATTEGEAGPELLSKMFPIGTAGPGKRQHPFSVTRQTAVLGQDGRWMFSGQVKRAGSTDGPWQVRVALRFSTDDGADGGVVGAVEADKGVAVVVKKGRAVLEVPAGRSKVTLKGFSDPSLHPVEARRAAVRLEITAGVREKGEED